MTLSELFDKADEMVAKRYSDCNASIKEINSYRNGYIHGMTEKLEGMVSVEKVCEWVEDNVENVFVCVNGIMTELNGIELSRCIHKAMEE